MKNSSTKRTTPLGLCCWIAEYTAPVWSTSTHAYILETEQNKACQAITGCLKPTYVEYLYLLVGIVPLDISRDVCGRMVRIKYMEQETHSLFCDIPTRARRKSRKEFMTSVKPSYFPTEVVRCSELHRKSWDQSCLDKVNLIEEQAMGYDSPSITWPCLNSLRTTSMETQHVRVGWPHKTLLTWYDVLSCHIPPRLMIFQSSILPGGKVL